LPEEIENCRPYFLEELDLLKNVKIIVPLGQIAFIQTLRSLRLKGFEIPSIPFGHGRVYEVSLSEGSRTPNSQPRTVTLVVTYHPSQQNTQTGRLTRPMFHQIFEMIKQKVRS
jgi:uracil-DNA glycosylase